MEEKKYNLFTAISMVVGIVIGSGVFFKASNILKITEGNLPMAILAWIVGGLIMIISAYVFSLIASNTSKNGDLATLAEETAGRKHSYAFSWYNATIYYPMLTAVLAWVSSNFICILFEINSLVVLVLISIVLLLCSLLLNFLAPKAAGYFQVSAATIKIIPLIIMGIVGTIYGLFFNDGILIENLTDVSTKLGGNGFMGAIVATAFAYEGWICATSITNDLKEPKKNLPKALVLGTIIVLAIYIVYYIGLAGTFPNNDFVQNGDAQIKLAFAKIFGSVGGTILYVFVIVSCLGTLNGLTMGSVRCFNYIAETGNGPCPNKLSQLNTNNLNKNSFIISFILCFVWLAIWLFMLYQGIVKDKVWAMDISELVIILVYAFYIPMYISIIKSRSDLNKFNRYVAPVVAVLASIFMVIAGFISHGFSCIIFFIFSAIILAIGFKFYKGEANESNS